MNDGDAERENNEKGIGDPDQLSAKQRRIDIESDRFEYPQSDRKEEEDDIDELLFFNGVHNDEHSKEDRKRSSCEELEKSC